MKGPKGQLTRQLPPNVTVKIDGSHVAVGLGNCDIYVKSVADARALTAAFARAAGLLEEAAGPSPWNVILKEDPR